MAKVTCETLVEGGNATTGPPIGPTLGSTGVNLQQVVDKINKMNRFVCEQTRSYFHKNFWTKNMLWKTILVLLGVGGCTYILVKIVLQIIVVNYFSN